ncbi:hypothetical protein T484DRAFT_1924146 [Baffinella frigidus]|nr:hypothetical protein T484DRAFT_1924146 [Cryptophyta sp. CCMP2293]
MGVPRVVQQTTNPNPHIAHSKPYTSHRKPQTRNKTQGAVLGEDGCTACVWCRPTLNPKPQTLNEARARTINPRPSPHQPYTEQKTVNREPKKQTCAQVCFFQVGGARVLERLN